jgi:hypothetical protein
MVLRVDANGDTLWQRDYPFTTNGMAQAITQASDGSFAVTGFASVENHSIQTFFARIDSLGTLIELRYYGGETTDYGRDIITVREGGYFIVSSSSSFSDHVWDIFALRLDADGDSLWGRIIDCGIFNWAERCKETVDGDFVIFGQCYEEGIYYTSLARVTESGEVLWQERHLVGDFFIYGGLDVDQHNRYLFCAKQTWDTALVMLTEPDSVYSAARIPSLPQHQSLVVEAFPNPFNSQITIRVRGVSTRGMQIELINVLGQVSNRVEIESNPTERAEFTLDGSLLPAGIYFVRASVGNRSAVSKIVLTK